MLIWKHWHYCATHALACYWKYGFYQVAANILVCLALWMALLIISLFIGFIELSWHRVCHALGMTMPKDTLEYVGMTWAVKNKYSQDISWAISVPSSCRLILIGQRLLPAKPLDLNDKFVLKPCLSGTCTVCCLSEHTRDIDCLYCRRAHWKWDHISYWLLNLRRTLT